MLYQWGFDQSSFLLLQHIYGWAFPSWNFFLVFHNIVSSFSSFPSCPTFLFSSQFHLLYLNNKYCNSLRFGVRMPSNIILYSPLDDSAILMNLTAMYGSLIYSYLYISNLNHSPEPPIYSTIYLMHLLITSKVPETQHVKNCFFFPSFSLTWPSFNIK